MKSFNDRPLIGRNLILLRQTHDMTLQKLADESGVGISTLHNIETGKASPRYDTLYSIAVVFGLKPHDLMSETLFIGEI